ncbi:MAG: alpha/beta hydrolase [Planctomycetota bacterium]|nr:alpha/beta hydrolase [Planctomycetota bacterium]
MIEVRAYGSSGPSVVVLHGGPGARGYMASVARGLAHSFRVLEPLQRRSGGEPLTVAGHVADLHEVVESRCAGERPALVGSSWGAMLALAYGAAHPDRVGALVLVGSGTFDLAARERMRAILAERMNPGFGELFDRLSVEVPDPDERLRIMSDQVLPVYSHDLVTDDLEVVDFDGRGNEECWNDMLRLQGEGAYPAAFAAIDAPVLMLHGAVDPHPGKLIRDSLTPHLPQLEYREWEPCGHYPWLERAVRDEFFAVLREWIALRCASP